MYKSFCLSWGWGYLTWSKHVWYVGIVVCVLLLYIAVCCGNYDVVCIGYELCVFERSMYVWGAYVCVSVWLCLCVWVVYEFVYEFMYILSVKWLAHVICYIDCTCWWLLLVEVCCNSIVYLLQCSRRECSIAFIDSFQRHKQVFIPIITRHKRLLK